MPSLRALAVLVALAACVLALPTSAHAAVSCPNANPVLNENNCTATSTWSNGYQMQRYSDDIGGFSTKTSFNLGESVPLKIARNAPTFPATKVNLEVYRMGYYGSFGGRLVFSANNVTVNNDQTCKPMDPTTGLLSCSNWNVTYTIPGTALPASGIYIVKLTTTDTSIQNQIIFTVRDDNRTVPSKILYVLPIATYQAYNNWGGKSLYFDKNFGANTILNNPRAAKVSFDRPYDNAEGERNRFWGPDSSLVYWLEQQGYDVSYSDDIQASIDGAALKQHKILIAAAHSEYWSLEQYNNFLAARDAGVSLAALSSNTTYWKVRYEDNFRTLVCYKTVGADGSNGANGVNDPGPDGIAGTADDALGADGVANTADDKPQNATTTWRDNGAPKGDPNAPPGGRVGPDKPENQLWGNMYVGDNEAQDYPLTVPAANANGEYAGDRVWRNTGLSTNTSTAIGTNLVGWEWDAVPTQAQYLSRQPAGVKRLTSTDTSAPGDTWLQDEGLLYASTPPAGEPSVTSAVKYKAASGAWVFSSGTNQWAYGLDDPRISQATYNIFSDMGVQPQSPTGLTLDPAGNNQPPTASFTMTPNPSPTAHTVTFNGSASTDSDGTIANYSWDLDGDGTFETSSGTSPTVTHSYAAEGSFDVHLKVTDNGGASDFTTRTLTIIDNQPPTAAVTASPNPAVSGQDVTFSGANSTDPDGHIARYEWDFDGNGTYETDGGASPTITHAFSAAGTYTVGLRVTDSGSPAKTATTTIPVTVNQGGLSNYGDAVLATPGLVDYWRMGEANGPTLADSKGTSNATATGGTFGQTGGPPSDTNTAVKFNGSTDSARADVDLSGTSKVTVEFWLKWDAYNNNDQLAMEFTSNFNNADGGFLVDPNAPQFGGTFGVAIGRDGSRNTAYFARPTAGVWHHYAFVLDSSAPAATEITPYVDGQAVSYQQGNTGTGAGPFANSTLFMMSRGGTSLFGPGTLDEVALYNRALDANTISIHAQSYGTNRRPVAAFTMSPSPARLNQTVTFNASTSHDPDGSIVKYEWDLDGNGSYETSTTSPTVTRSYSTEQSINVGLRVTDNGFGQDSTTKTLFTGNAPPTPAFTVTPNPAAAGQTVKFDASASSDPDGSVAGYKWDFDGNGTFETDTGTTAKTSHVFATTGTYNVGLQATDNEGKTATTIVPVTINQGGVSNYGDAVQRTSGLVHYWRLGEAAGTSALADSAATATATPTAVTLGVPGAMLGDPNTAARFNGTSSSAQASVDLSGTSKLTVEFWLKWNRYANDDALAMEFTPNFNGADGGFLVDPNAPQFGGTFGVAFGVNGTRNNVFFARPSAGVWHHYAFALDGTAPGATAITPYVDGQAVSYQKADSGTGMSHFANSTLYLMSRAGQALFGGGDLDEVALYNRTLTASEVLEHAQSYGTNRRPVASFTASTTTPKLNQTVTFDGSGSHDPDGTIVDYQWDLDGNGTYETDTGTNPVVTKSYTAEGPVNVSLRVTDDGTGRDTQTKTITVGDNPPTAAFTVSPSPALVGGTVSLDASASADSDGTITDYAWDLDGNGTYETDAGTHATSTTTYATAGQRTIGLKVTDNDGKSSTTTHTLNVKSGTYSAAVLGTPGLISYWRLGDSAGSTLKDAFGGHDAVLGSGLLGVPGALSGDTNTAISFNGLSDYASVPLDLSGTSQLTVEFWLKWNRYAADDDLAMEFTPNFNDNSGGFLVDPDAGSQFGVSIGRGPSRNNVFFPQPSAGQWHHLAFVFDATAAGATQITPYVDGQPVSYIKFDSGTGAGPFANSTLYFMSRAGTSLFGPGSLDEVALYRQALSASTIAAHYGAGAP